MPDVRAAPHLPESFSLRHGAMAWAVATFALERIRRAGRGGGRGRPDRRRSQLCGADAVPAVAVAPRRIIARAAEITEDDLAEAECQADLCHVDAVA